MTYMTNTERITEAVEAMMDTRKARKAGGVKVTDVAAHLGCSPVEVIEEMDAHAIWHNPGTATIAPKAVR
jgi:hypothetical protein